MVGGDAAQVRVGGVGADAAEEDADLDLPLPQVGAEDRRLLVVADLGRGEALGAAAEAQLALAGRAEVAHPLRVSAGRDQVPGAVDGQEVDRRGPDLPARASAHREDPAPVDAQPASGDGGDEGVEDVGGDPPGLLESLQAHAPYIRSAPASEPGSEGSMRRPAKWAMKAASSSRASAPSSVLRARTPPFSRLTSTGRPSSASDQAQKAAIHARRGATSSAGMGMSMSSPWIAASNARW